MDELPETLIDWSNGRTNLYRGTITFGQSLELDERTSLNLLVHALMTFGPDHPVAIGEDTTISVLEFIQSYFDYLPTEVREHAVPWIDRVGDEHFVIMSYMPRILIDHLGQLFYACALAEVPLDTRVKLKSGCDISLERLLKTQIKYADPEIHDPTWQTAALAHYWPDMTWRSVNRRSLSALDFLEKTSSHVTGHFTCGHTHPLISSAYAISRLEERHAVSDQKRRQLEACKQRMDQWIDAIRETLYPNGMVSAEWHLNEKRWPRTMQEVILYNGHVLEFLVVYLDENRLKSEWVKRIADRFCLAVIESARNCPKTGGCERSTLPFEYTSLCHGVRGLLVYCRKTNADEAIERDAQ
ncbi:MAG: hypothetical protein ACYTBJ_20735 [Planctomycetota bacterium]